jgi:hypothetical protein
MEEVSNFKFALSPYISQSQGDVGQPRVSSFGRQALGLGFSDSRLRLLSEQVIYQGG